MLPLGLLDDWIRTALREDLGSGDLTTELLIPPGRTGRARFIAKESLIVAGLGVSVRVFELLSPECVCTPAVADGDAVERGRVLLELEGPLSALLAGERVSLNILQHLSGVATLTRQFADAVRGTGVRILDTRKTLPGLRALEKYAVRAGGGHNHRSSLADGILIKENHIVACGGVAEAVRRAREAAPHGLRAEVEATTLDEVREALEAGAEAILLDNMPLETIRAAVRLVAGAALLEVSGGVTLENVRAVAETGVDMISVGRLTHSAPGVDISMLVRDDG
ncbi:MAG: carboxylating nicotinate-nucleotide diphosphorylase [bacterium]